MKHLLLTSLCFLLACQNRPDSEGIQAPNILLVILDDQSYPHTSIYGYEAIETPAFDQIAEEGILFTQAFAASPGCSPSRAALLTGRHCWQLEHAGTHASLFPPTYHTYPDLLEQAGYAVGYTGKGWGPGDWQGSGRTHNPAGPEWNDLLFDEVPKGISNKNYAANFDAFLKSRKEDQPFCFWFGAHEPHRIFESGIGDRNGKQADRVEVPHFLPDNKLVRNDILDYCFEIEWADQHLQKMLNNLAEIGELDNTLIIVTADNGMAFPRAKANVYEFGIHVPLAIRWGDKIKGGRVVDDLIGFIDLAPTILEASEIEHPGKPEMRGQSIMPILQSQQSGKLDRSRKAVFSSRERHSSSRYHSLGYPQRAIRTDEYLYIHNFKPERWPAGAPTKFGEGNYPGRDPIEKHELGFEHGGYHDIDACPTMEFLIEHRDRKEAGPYFHWVIDKRPQEELYAIQSDPSCLKNLATDTAYATILEAMRKQLMAELQETRDPRVLGEGDIWETYPRYSRLRAFPIPEWAEDHPEAVPEQAWLQEHWERQWEK